MVSVSVIIRTVGDKYKIKLLELTMYSLSKQTFKDFEVIIVTYMNRMLVESIAKKYLNRIPYKVVTSHIKNRCYQTNLGIKIAKGKYIVVMDDDMILSSNWLEVMFRLLKASSPRIACICSPVYSIKIIKRKESSTKSHFNSYLKILKILNALSLSRCFWPKHVRQLANGIKELPTIPSNCIICRRDVVMKVGLYNTRLHEPLRGDDYDLGFRLKKSGYKILSCNFVKALHIEDYTRKWVMLSHTLPKIMENMLETEFYVLTKFREFTKIHVVLSQALYRIFEILYLARKTRNPYVILSAKGIIRGLVLGIKEERN